MGLEKAIQHGKEHRKPFKGAKAIDVSCRNHGDCELCRDNRLHSARVRAMKGSIPMLNQILPKGCDLTYHLFDYIL